MEWKLEIRGDNEWSKVSMERVEGSEAHLSFGYR